MRIESRKKVTDSTDTIQSIRAWIRDSHLLNRTGAGAFLVFLGLVSAVKPSPAAWGIAALCGVTGAVIRFWSAGIISKNRELATSGPYAFVRNPLYTGSMLIAIGFLILNGNPWFAIPAVIGAVVLYMRTIEGEEADLRNLFGADFDRYREQVPAVIPWRGRVATGDSGETTYSLEQSLFNNELNGVAGTVGMLTMFYCYLHWIPAGVFHLGSTLVVVTLMAVRGYRRVHKQRNTAPVAASQDEVSASGVETDPAETEIVESATPEDAGNLSPAARAAAMDPHSPEEADEMLEILLSKRPKSGAGPEDMLQREAGSDLHADSDQGMVDGFESTFDELAETAPEHPEDNDVDLDAVAEALQSAAEAAQDDPGIEGHRNKPRHGAGGGEAEGPNSP